MVRRGLLKCFCLCSISFFLCPWNVFPTHKSTVCPTLIQARFVRFFLFFSSESFNEISFERKNEEKKKRWLFNGGFSAALKYIRLQLHITTRHLIDSLGSKLAMKMLHSGRVTCAFESIECPTYAFPCANGSRTLTNCWVPIGRCTYSHRAAIVPNNWFIKGIQIEKFA